MKNKGFRLSGKRLLMLAGVVLLLASAAAVYFTWQDLYREVKTSDVQTSVYQTQQVNRGDITLSATGTGSLVAGSEADVSFPLTGRLAELNVKVGDVVSAGDVLAVLDGVDQLEINVKTKTIQLNQAKEALAEYQSSGEENLAQAAIDLADAQATYQDALDNLPSKGRRALR